MNALIVIVAILEALFAGGSCQIDTVTPYTGQGTIEWQGYPTGGVDYFATMNLYDTRTGAAQFYETDGSYRAYDGVMTMYFELDRGHVWKASEVSCYIVYPSGASDVTAPNSLTWIIDTRWRAFIPILRR